MYLTDETSVYGVIKVIHPHFVMNLYFRGTYLDMYLGIMHLYLHINFIF